MEYNVAVVGCGSMGVEQFFDRTIPFTYSFAGAVFKNSRTRLVALVDTDLAKLAEINSRLISEGHLGIPIYASLEEAVEAGRRCDRPIHITCAAAGPQMNSEIVRKARALGIHGVYCEKPLTLSLAEADELAEIEAKTGVKIQVNYLRNFDACHLAILDYIRNGGIGDLLIIRILYKGGVIAVAPHGIALINLLLGKPIEVIGYHSPLLNTRCLDDPNVDGLIQYPHHGRYVNVSIMATGRGDLKNDTYLFELEFTGTKSRISILENGWRVRYERMEPSRVFGSTGGLKPYDSARLPLELKADAPREFMIEGLANLINAIEGDERTKCSAAAARDAEEVAHALALSASRAKAISIPLEDRKHAFQNMVAGVRALRKEAGKE